MPELTELLADLTRRESSLLSLRDNYAQWDTEGAIRTGYKLEGLRLTMELVRGYIARGKV